MENKRIKKFLKREDWKKWLKPVTSDNDPVDFIILENPKCLTFSVLFETKEYTEAVERGENIPERAYSLLHYS